MSFGQITILAMTHLLAGSTCFLLACILGATRHKQMAERMALVAHEAERRVRAAEDERDNWKALALAEGMAPVEV